MVKALSGLIFRSRGPFLDFGGADGLFARMMRDIGLDYWSEDKYAHNARCDLSMLGPTPNRFRAITLFEVFEHLVDPLETLRSLFERSDNVFFTTEPLPEGDLDADWWYFSWESGQHVLFATNKGIQRLANALGVSVSSVGQFHLMSRSPISHLRFRMAILMGRLVPFLVPVLTLVSSLSQDDMERIRRAFRASQNGRHHSNG